MVPVETILEPSVERTVTTLHFGAMPICWLASVGIGQCGGQGASSKVMSLFWTHLQNNIFFMLKVNELYNLL